MVFYRKYRPQKIEELDSEPVRKNLYSIFAKSESAHAFLFTGPKGLGKTSTARIVAKVINCEKHKNQKETKTEKDIEPCNTCSQCTSISNGSNLDVLEIDGASNRGIDEIRDLKEKINLAPFKAGKKIYVIDEVHMLTSEAFNALLKTLEEPPAHAVFILCTTELSKIPATIVSRCFRINFTKATNDELLRSMQRIVKKEGIKIENEALLEIAKLADGSFRDGTKILEEVLNFAGDKLITKDLIGQKFNILGFEESVNQFLDSLINKETGKALAICQKLANQGADFKFFIEQLINRIHLDMLRVIGVENNAPTIKLSLAEIQKLFIILSKAHLETKGAVLAELPLEIAILEWVKEGENSSHDVVVSNIISTPSQATQVKEEENMGFFNQLINEIKNHNNLFAGVLRGCRAQDIKNDKLIIIASSKFHKEKIEEAKNLKLLEKTAKDITGKDIVIEVILKSKEVSLNE